jgi:hypothetical protein
VPLITTPESAVMIRPGTGSAEVVGVIHRLPVSSLGTPNKALPSHLATGRRAGQAGQRNNAATAVVVGTPPRSAEVPLGDLVHAQDKPASVRRRCRLWFAAFHQGT